MKKIISGFEKERNVLVISSIVIAFFIFFSIDLTALHLTYENTLITLLALNAYFAIRLILEWLKSKELLINIAVPLLLGSIAMGYIVYKLSLTSIIFDTTLLSILLILGIGEFTAYLISLNVEYSVYRRSDTESSKTYLPKTPFALKSKLKYIPLSLLLLLVTGLCAEFILSAPVNSFWFIILLFPFSVHILALAIYFISIDKDDIAQNIKIFDEQDKNHLLSTIGMKLANKKSTSCRKTTTEQYQTVMHFLENGLDPNEIFENRYTLLLPSTCCGDFKLVKLLIEYGANVNFVSSNGVTALHLASEHGSTELAQLLVKSGADINIKNPQGKTALDFAKESKSEDIVKLLTSE
ncbi:ankyrin repeat domain-containing protein [Sulfurimonas sp.]|uniref:ankyrin repeat domain-containing protein n=1 Tax=Sulfurimonas sp. TaxID=2022749 RepID=UPI003567B77D